MPKKAATKTKKISNLESKLPRKKNRQTIKPSGKEAKDTSIEIVDKNPKAKLGEIAYYVKFKEVKIGIIKSANAWWAKPIKVQEFCQALRIGCEIKEACVYAGITYAQWEYFVKQHKEFYELKDILQEWPIMRIRHTVVNGALNDPKLGLEYLQVSRPKQFNKRLNIGHSGTIGIRKDLNEETDPVGADKADEATANIVDLIGEEHFENEE